MLVTGDAIGRAMKNANMFPNTTGAMLPGVCFDSQRNPTTVPAQVAPLTIPHKLPNPGFGADAVTFTGSKRNSPIPTPIQSSNSRSLFRIDSLSSTGPAMIMYIGPLACKKIAFADVVLRVASTNKTNVAA